MHRWLLLPLLLACAACSADSTTAPLALDRPAAADAVSDSLAVRAVIGRLDAAWKAMDPAGFAKEFATDAQFVSIIGLRMNGQSEILTRHQFLFGGPFKGSTLLSAVVRLRFLGPLAATVETDAQLTGYAALPAGVVETAPGVLRTRFLHVLQKVNGVWSITSGQNTSIPPG